MTAMPPVGMPSFDDILHGDRPDAPEPGLLATLVPHLAPEDVETAVAFFLGNWSSFVGRPVGEEAVRALGARLSEIDLKNVNALHFGPGLPRLAEQMPLEARVRFVDLVLAGAWARSGDELAALVATLPADRSAPFVVQVAQLLPEERQTLALAHLAPMLGGTAVEEALASARADTTQDGALALAELALRNPELLDEAAARLDEVTDEGVRFDLAARLGIEQGSPPGPLAPPEHILDALEHHLAAESLEGRATLARRALGEMLSRWGGYRALAGPPEGAPPDEDDWHVAAAEGGGDGEAPEADDQWMDAYGAEIPPFAPEPEVWANPAPSERYVNVGVARPDGGMMGSALALACSTRYLLAVEIGGLLSGGAGGAPVRFPDELLAEDAELTVVLYAPKGGLVLDESARTGRFRLGSRDVEVLQRPVSAPADAEWANAIWFPVRAPQTPGPARVRVSLFCNATLVQSILLEASVREQEQPEANAVSAETDFTLARSLRPETVNALASDDFSVFVNRAGDDANFYLQGAPDGPLTATIDGHEVEGLIRNARAALRQVAWGTVDEWQAGIDTYRYVDSDRERLSADLERLAIAGFSIYDVVIDAFTERPAQQELERALRKPGQQIQIASKNDPRFVIPAAMLYNRANFGDQDAHRTCEGFLAALDSPEPLDEAPCFTGRCPTEGDSEAICPSGFWGFRHNLGMPISIETDAPATIAVVGDPTIVAGASTDKLLTLRVDHIDRIRGLRTPVDWRYSENADELLTTLEGVAPAVVYFFCHGGLTEDDRPYIRIGANDGKAITRAMLRDLVWEDGGPLVVINGCHTTAVSPEQAINLVSGFLKARAAGVVGTEITVMQELAVPFAEGLLRRFLRDRQPLGAAIRGARLDLLKQGNPLGLAYIPFGSAGVRLAA